MSSVILVTFISDFINSMDIWQDDIVSFSLQEV